MSILLSLFLSFLMLSLLAVGGAITLAPEMHRLLVDEMHLLNDTQFSAAIAIAQAAPGPNVLFVAVLGYQAAGLLGALATFGGIMLPSTTLALAAARWGQERKNWRGVLAFKAGMAPIVIALMFATGWVLSSHDTSGPLIALTAAATVLVWRTRIHLLILIAFGALIGGLGWL